MDTNEAMDRLRAANPIATVDALDPAEIAAVVTECDDVVEADRLARERNAPVDRRTDGASVRRRAFLRPATAFGVAFAVIVFAVVTAAFVGRNSGPPAEPATVTTVPVVVPTPTVPDATTLPSVPSTTLDARAPGGVSTIDGIEYYSDDDVTLTMSAFYPETGSGPWPVVVIYHDRCVDCPESLLARDLASRGAVVFAPSWVPSMGTAEEYVDGHSFDRAACAVGVAQARAEELGGNPRATTVTGTAGGEHPAAWAALGVASADVCDEPIRYQPTGLVTGQPQFIFQQDFWDPAFGDPGNSAHDTIDRFLNPARWDTSDDLAVLIHSTAFGGNSRDVAADGSDQWLVDRDTTGSLIDDLARLGAFDDGLILFNDNARLFDLRIRNAGLGSTLMLEERTSWIRTPEIIDAIWDLVAPEG